jgi:membrane protein YqaA with SNARE-associated domain
MIESAIHWLLNVLAIPDIGLGSVFVVSFVSATLLPLGSEPAVFAVVKANAVLFWPAILVATLGNTLGGALNYWIGRTAKRAFANERSTRWFGSLQRYGAKTMLLVWLPAIGDPIAMLGGWLRLPFWSCVFYMAIGKFARYVMTTWLLLRVPDGFWRQVAHWLA